VKIKLIVHSKKKVFPSEKKDFFYLSIKNLKINMKRHKKREILLFSFSIIAKIKNKKNEAIICNFFENKEKRIKQFKHN
jgi:hypothetical protein